MVYDLKGVYTTVGSSGQHYLYFTDFNPILDLLHLGSLCSPAPQEKIQRILECRSRIPAGLPIGRDICWEK